MGQYTARWKKKQAMPYRINAQFAIFGYGHCGRTISSHDLSLCIQTLKGVDSPWRVPQNPVKMIGDTPAFRSEMGACSIASDTLYRLVRETTGYFRVCRVVFL